ncbi:hypothetical protein Pelo_12431 [Pelomyxa schiedti]|nr:hypothetical protein Pelo_12431 [Pelomyxa schiedti]
MMQRDVAVLLLCLLLSAIVGTVGANGEGCEVDCDLAFSRAHDKSSLCLCRVRVCECAHNGGFEAGSVSAESACDSVYRECMGDSELQMDQECDLATGNCGTRSADGDSPSARVAMFSSTVDSFYLFFTPITSLLWSNLGYTPVLQVATHDNDPPYVKFALDMCRKAGALVYEGFTDPSEDGEWEITAVQVARLYGFMMSLPSFLGDDPYILTSDADMWPLSEIYFDNQKSTKPLHLLYANAYRRGDSKVANMFPICYIGATASVWHDIMQPATMYPGSQNPVAWAEAEVKYQLKQAQQRYGAKWKVGDKATSPRWYYDQILFGSRVTSWGKCPDECLMVDRSVGRDRVDRGAWQQTYNTKAGLAGKIDSHVLRPGTDDSNWEKLKDLLQFYVSPSQLEWLSAYKERFVELSHQQL